MHEMSLAEGIIQLLEDQAKAQDFSRVKQVWLSIGELAGVEVEALDFAWKWSAVTRWPPEQSFICAPASEGWCLACQPARDNKSFRRLPAVRQASGASDRRRKCASANWKWNKPPFHEYRQVATGRMPSERKNKERQQCVPFAAAAAGNVKIEGRAPGGVKFPIAPTMRTAMTMAIPRPRPRPRPASSYPPATRHSGARRRRTPAHAQPAGWRRSAALRPGCGATHRA
jgi:Zn finger protein HypA/HybF involved in hydrogenase expression